MTSLNCRAKNQSRCRVHGSPATGTKTWFHNHQDIEPKIVFTRTAVPLSHADTAPLGVQVGENSYIFHFAKDASGEDAEQHELDAVYEIDGTTLAEVKKNLAAELTWLREIVTNDNLSTEMRKAHLTNYVRLNNLRKTLDENCLSKIKKSGISYKNVLDFAKDSEHLNMDWELGAGSIHKILKYGKAVSADYSQLPEAEQAIVLTQSLAKHEPALLSKDVNWKNPEYPSYAEDLWNIYKQAELQLTA